MSSRNFGWAGGIAVGVAHSRVYLAVNERRHGMRDGLPLVPRRGSCGSVLPSDMYFI